LVLEPKDKASKTMLGTQGVRALQCSFNPHGPFKRRFDGSIGAHPVGPKDHSGLFPELDAGNGEYARIAADADRDRIWGDFVFILCPLENTSHMPLRVPAEA
jgi:hypothetical protein